jgi:CelD/BcsL family acetyltransferase involved in cellulose biosynthesis
MSLRVDVVSSASGCDALREDWNRLLSERKDATPFETWEWNHANLITFENQALQMLVFRDQNSRVTAILPLVLRRVRKYLRRRLWLEFAGLPYADYATYLVRGGQESKVANALVDYLRSVRSSWDGVYLDHMSEDDDFTRCLHPAAIAVGMFAMSQPTSKIRRLAKAAYAAGSHFGLQSSKALAKARRKLSEVGEVSFEVMSKESEILKHLESYFQMHIERALAKGVRSPLETSGQQKFFRNIVSTCSPSGGVWLSSLVCAGLPVAYRLSLRYYESLHLYSTCFAPAYAKYSPSMLLLDSLLEYAFGHGIRIVDFGMGDSPQKEKAGAIADKQMTRVEMYLTQEAYAESRLYLAAQRIAGNSAAFRRGAQFLRRLLPYQQ